MPLLLKSDYSNNQRLNLGKVLLFWNPAIIESIDEMAPIVKKNLGFGFTIKAAASLAHPEKIIVESDKILIQWDFGFKQVDTLECQKIQKSKSSR